MASKRKKPQVAKVRSVTPEPPKSPKPDKSVEDLVRHNGELVESLCASQVWIEIIEPLIAEGIASVSGRLTNGRYYHGDLTRTENDRGKYLSGYQRALMDFYNYLNDFVIAKDKLIKDKKVAEKEKGAPLYNPFMEEEDESV